MPYRSIDDPTKLRRILKATLLLEGDLELPALLRHVVDEARSMTGAKYCALGVLNDDHTALVEFITAGLAPDQETAIGERPTGKGILGLLIADPRVLRLSEMDQHQESSGFPPNHPPMTSFLGVPIKVRDEVYGNLYLTDKVGWSEFTKDDAALVEALALAAGIAIENARLHQRVQVVAVYEDRDRLARDLHDTVIQRLFGVGLTLQGMAARTPPEITEGLQNAVAEIDRVIHQVRSTIYELGMGTEARGLRDEVVALVRDLQSLVGFEVHVTFKGPIDSAIPDPVREQLLPVIRESVANIGRHAHATQAVIAVDVEDDWCQVSALDNGVGYAAAPIRPGGGLGLNNLRQRAEKLHGTFSIGPAEGGGTLVTWRVPLGS